MCAVLGAAFVFVRAGSPSGLGLRSGYGHSYGHSSSYNSVRDFNNNSFSAGDLPGYKPANGSGVLGSSMYKASPTAAPRTGGSQKIPSTGALMAVRPSSQRISSPTAPMVIRPTPPPPRRSPAAGTSAISYRSPSGLSLLTPVLKSKDVKPVVVPTGNITSLVPDREGRAREYMLKGEAAFKRGAYEEARRQFQEARVTSAGSPESLLAIAHTYLATDAESYDNTAEFIGKTIDKFPKLPEVNVHPESFFGNKSDYRKVLDKLQKYSKTKPKDAPALFVLGYAAWRDKDFIGARQTVRRAIDNCSDTTLKRQMRAMLDGMTVDRKTLLAMAPKMDQAKSFPHAGIKLALPTGFELQQLSHINKVFVAAQNTAPTKRPRSIAMSIYPAIGDVTRRGFMDQMIAQAKREPSIKNVKVVEEKVIPFLKTTALARLITCRYQGAPVTVVRMCFLREVKQPGTAKDAAPTKFMYQLGVGVLAEDTDFLLPAFAAVVNSISLTDFTSPTDLLKTVDGHEVADTHLGFSITQPSGWSGRKTPTGFEMGQIDCLAGGTVTPEVKVVLAIVPESFTPESLAKSAFKKRTQQGYKIDILSDKPAKLGDKTGREFIVRKTAPKNKSEQPPGAVQAEGAYIEAGRIILVPDKKGSKRMFALVVTCRKASQQRAGTLLDNFAKNFKLLK